MMTLENTEGYTQAELDTLNAEFARRWAAGEWTGAERDEAEAWFAAEVSRHTVMASWLSEGVEMVNMTDPPITGPEFDALYPDPQTWRQAGRPDYGFRQWHTRMASEHGWVEGVDYEAGLSENFQYVRIWCRGGARVDVRDPAPPMNPLQADEMERDRRARGPIDWPFSTARPQ